MGECILLVVVLLHFISSVHKIKVCRTNDFSNKLQLDYKVRILLNLKEYFLMPVILIVITVYCIYPSYWVSVDFPEWIQCVGIVFIILSGLLKIWAYRVLGQNWSQRISIYNNHTLIMTGPYALVRHPVYTSYLLIFVGATLFAGSFVLFGLGFIYFVINIWRANIEEVFLVKEFGLEYEKYQSSVGQFIPNQVKVFSVVFILVLHMVGMADELAWFFKNLT